MFIYTIIIGAMRDVIKGGAGAVGGAMTSFIYIYIYIYIYIHI